jgi:V/A-type H+/Na+-transporting ATPase subunit E
MAVEDILKRIEADAETEARAILESAQAEADSTSEQARKRVDGEREKLLSVAKQRAGEERNRIVTLARLEARRDELSEKQKLIDLVFERTRERIIKMGRDEYRRLIAAFLTETAASGE